MNDVINVKERQPIWLALSLFYLDTELQTADFEGIAASIIASPYSLDDVKRIDKYEVFPVLQPNLLIVAGEWVCFDEQWLISRILESLRYRNAIRKLVIEATYRAFGWMHTDYWIRLETIYHRARTSI